MDEPARLEAAQGHPPVGHARRRRSRRRSQPDAARLRRRRLRLVYFILASIWGFMSGTVALLASLVVLGQPLQLQTPVVLAMLIAALLALVGGVVAARAYREATQRS
jgi:hypothetical protein